MIELQIYTLNSIFTHTCIYKDMVLKVCIYTHIHTQSYTVLTQGAKTLTYSTHSPSLFHLKGPLVMLSLSKSIFALLLL